jgi:hypothetical protein
MIFLTFSSPPMQRVASIDINYAPTSDNVERFQFVNYKFMYYEEFQGLPLLANVYSKTPVRLAVFKDPGFLNCLLF